MTFETLANPLDVMVVKKVVEEIVGGEAQDFCAVV